MVLGHVEGDFEAGGPPVPIDELVFKGVVAAELLVVARPCVVGVMPQQVVGAEVAGNVVAYDGLVALPAFVRAADELLDPIVRVVYLVRIRVGNVHELAKIAELD